MKIILGKILYFLGFMWCPDCGTKLTYWYSHGFDNEDVYFVGTVEDEKSN